MRLLYKAHYFEAHHREDTGHEIQYQPREEAEQYCLKHISYITPGGDVLRRKTQAGENAIMAGTFRLRRGCSCFIRLRGVSVFIGNRLLQVPCSASRGEYLQPVRNLHQVRKAALVAAEKTVHSH